MTRYVERTWTSPDGLILNARDYAPGPGPARLPVVCLHGLTRNARDFEALAPGSPTMAAGCWRRTCAAAADRRGIPGRSATCP
jgi:hypothetical protein